jgi:hypothetical protein
VTNQLDGPIPPMRPIRVVSSDPRRPQPASVRYARSLVYVQALIWGLICVVALVNATAPVPVASRALVLSAAGVAAALAGAKAALGRRIPRGWGETRIAVIVAEALMACLGALGAMVSLPAAAASPFGAPVGLACLVGGALSLVAVIALAQPPARQYFGSPDYEVERARPVPRPGDGGSALFGRVAPAITS